MWAQGKYLLNDITGMQTLSRLHKSLDFHKIINLQQNVIKTLQREIIHLRQYVFFTSDLDEKKPDDISFQSTVSELKNMNSVCSEKITNKVYGIKSLLEQIMSFFNISELKAILPEIKKLQERANRKVQPVFIEKVKQKEVPVYIQKIKEIEKPVILEKNKDQEKIISPPICQHSLDRINTFLQNQDFSLKLKQQSANYGKFDPQFFLFSPNKHKEKKCKEQRKPKRYRQKKYN